MNVLSHVTNFASNFFAGRKQGKGEKGKERKERMGGKQRGRSLMRHTHILSLLILTNE